MYKRKSQKAGFVVVENAPKGRGRKSMKKQRGGGGCSAHRDPRKRSLRGGGGCSYTSNDPRRVKQRGGGGCRAQRDPRKRSLRGGGGCSYTSSDPRRVKQRGGNGCRRRGGNKKSLRKSSKSKRQGRKRKSFVMVCNNGSADCAARK